MKRLSLLLVLCATVALAQQEAPVPAAPEQAAETNLAERAQAPSYSDLYCAGFITKQAISPANFVVGGGDTPNQTQFAQGNIIFLEGSGYQEGARFSVVRELRDPNRNPAFPGQGLAISAAGQPYAELGRVRVTTIRGKNAVAEVEFSCSVIVPGDLVTPFQEKSPVTYRPASTSNRFPASEGSVNARIVMAKDFDTVLGTGAKVYIDAGADKGIKPGDYFRAVRGYDPAKIDRVEALSYKVAQTEDSQKTPARIPGAEYAGLPKRALGELIVLNVTPTASTAMVTKSLESINVGDTVELEGAAAPKP